MSDFFTKQHGSVKVEDTTGTPLDYTFDDVGDWTLDNIEEGGKPIVRIKHRGSYVGSVYGDQQELTGSFSWTCKREALTGSGEKPLDTVRKAGSFASAISTGGSGAPMLWKMTYTLTDGTTTTTIVLNHVRLKASKSESGDAVVFTVNFDGYLSSVT